MDYRFEIVKPSEIEARSFELIGKELPDDLPFAENELPVLKRVIHATADFDYARNLTFTPGAVDRALELLKHGCTIVTDTNMALSGIHKSSLKKLGAEAVCFMADPDVAAEAKRQGSTRAAAAVEKAASLKRPLILAVGNAPTALIRTAELIRQGTFRPELIIGVPVGFVNVVPAKEKILKSGCPCIVARGRKGGSNVAAAICNALIYMASGER